MNFETVSTAPVSRGDHRLTYAHFRDLDHALLKENLAAARQAFASLQDDAPDLADIVQETPQPGDSPRRSSLKQLAQALRHGDLEEAQFAFLQFQETSAVESRRSRTG